MYQVAMHLVKHPKAHLIIDTLANATIGRLTAEFLGQDRELQVEAALAELVEEAKTKRSQINSRLTDLLLVKNYRDFGWKNSHLKRYHIHLGSPQEKVTFSHRCRQRRSHNRSPSPTPTPSHSQSSSESYLTLNDFSAPDKLRFRRRQFFSCKNIVCGHPCQNWTPTTLHQSTKSHPPYQTSYPNTWEWGE